MTIADLLSLEIKGVRVSSLWQEIQGQQGEYTLLGEDSLGYFWNQCSGGERQKALITRALFKSGRLLILDEPLNHLDENARYRALQLIHRYLERQSENRAVIMVVHEDFDSSWPSFSQLKYVDLSS